MEEKHLKDLHGDIITHVILVYSIKQNMMEMCHMTGYLEQPDKNDIQDLKKEISQIEQFGLKGRDDLSYMIVELEQPITQIENLTYEYVLYHIKYPEQEQNNESV